MSRARGRNSPNLCCPGVQLSSLVPSDGLLGSFRLLSAAATWQGAPPWAWHSARSWLYEVPAVTLACHALVGRRGQGHSETCEELARSDARPAGSAGDGSARPAPSRWRLLRLGVSELTLGFPRLAPSLPSDLSPGVTSPDELVSASLAAPSAASPAWLRWLLSGTPRSCTWMSVPSVCLSRFPRSPSPQGHL